MLTFFQCHPTSIPEGLVRHVPIKKSQHLSMHPETCTMHKAFGPFALRPFGRCNCAVVVPGGWTDTLVADHMQPFCVAKCLLELRGGVHCVTLQEA